MSQPWKPHGYMKRGIKFLIQQGAAGLFWDPGLGKTSTIYAAYKILKGLGLVDRMLVIAPLRPANSVWPKERDKWDDFAGVNVHVLHGAHKNVLLKQPHDVAVINPEGLGWFFKAMKGKHAWPYTMLVVDESTMFKNTQTLRFKTLKPHLPKFKRRYVLTGTPAPNGMLDLFGQVYILDFGSSLGRFITHYRQQYFDSAGFGGYQWQIKDGAEKVIYKKLKPLVMRLEAQDYIKLPPLVNNTVYVELPEKARKAYDQMEEILLTMVDEKMVSAVNMAAAGQKCRQIANGGAYYENMDEETPAKKKKWVNIHDAKTEAAVELVEELGGKPALIAYEFQHDLERLKKAFPEAPHLGGGVTDKRQKEIEGLWNAGWLPQLLVQPQSVAHGLNLQEVGAAVIFYGLTWNLEYYLQLVRRVWRQGQKERVVVHHIVARDTVDEAIMRTIAQKDKSQNALLDALKEYAKGKK